MSADSAPRVFVSAASGDLRVFREAVSKELRVGGCFPVVQEDFAPDTRSLPEFLDRELRKCRAVICLVGVSYGASPVVQSQSPPLSYTQLEYETARRLRLPVYVWLSAEDMDLPHDANEGEQERLLQRAHRKRVLQQVKCEWFRSIEDVVRLTSRIAPRLTQSARRLRILGWPPLAATFVGRELEMAQLRVALHEPHRPCMVLVEGIGGQGKSTLVRRGLSELEESTHFVGMFALSFADTSYDFEDFLDEALDYLLGEQFRKDAVVHTEQRVQLLVKHLQDERVLLVLDGVERCLTGWRAGADRRGAFPGFDEFLRAATNVGGGSRVVLTTRALPAALDGAAISWVPVAEAGRQLQLQGLDDDAACNLLATLGVRGSREEILKAARSCSNHPLALGVLGALVTKCFGGELSNWNLDDALAPENPEQRLHALFEETCRHLPGGSGTARAMRLIAHFLESPDLGQLAALDASIGSPSGAWGDALLDPLRLLRLWPKASAPTPSPDAALVVWRQRAMQLGDWHLVDWDAAAQRVSLHLLVRAYFAAPARGDPASLTIHAALSRQYETATAPAQPRSLDDARTRQLAIEHALAGDNPLRAAELFFAPFVGSAFVDWLADFGHLVSGVRIMQRIIGTNAKGLPIALWLALGGFLGRLGRSGESLAALNFAVQTLEMRPPSRDRDLELAAALMHRGNVKRDAGPLDADADYDHAVKLLDPLGPTAHPRLALTLFNRAGHRSDRGYLLRALDDTTRAEQIYRTLRVGNASAFRQDFAATLATHGSLLAELGHGREAFTFLDEGIGLLADQPRVGLNSDVQRLANIRVLRANWLLQFGDARAAVTEAEAAFALVQTGEESLRPDLRLPRALVNLTLASCFLDVPDLSRARDNSATAVRAFRKLRATTGLAVGGWLGNALLCHAEVAHRLGDTELARVDCDAGFAALEAFFEEERGGCGAWPMFVRKTVRAFRWLGTSDPTAATALVDRCCALAVRLSELCGGDIYDDCRIAADEFLAALSKWVGDGVDESRLDAVRKICKPPNQPTSNS